MALTSPDTKVTDFPSHQRRERLLPWIRFGIFNPKKEGKIVYPLGLVDSGSDITIIDHEFGEELGFDIPKAKGKASAVGIGGGKIEVYLHEIGLIFGDVQGARPIKYTDLIGFTSTGFPETMPQQTAILGTIGFFRNLRVTLNFPKHILIGPLL